ncbi:hypothetical protein GGX14DRAFT_399637 [Mycena pura]|uniref:Uncharacterized protein n=1 Tax=Mycena pura TaxID=153505 RepID=A0AAD6Y6L8_9AGAR|nr:hypothetical protein GGX14DRAFT_399637 [Mycena pura]
MAAGACRDAVARVTAQALAGSALMVPTDSVKLAGVSEAGAAGGKSALRHWLKTPTYGIVSLSEDIARVGRPLRGGRFPSGSDLWLPLACSETGKSEGGNAVVQHFIQFIAEGPHGRIESMSPGSTERHGIVSWQTRFVWKETSVASVSVAVTKLGNVAVPRLPKVRVRVRNSTFTGSPTTHRLASLAVQRSTSIRLFGLWRCHIFVSMQQNTFVGSEVLKLQLLNAPQDPEQPPGNPFRIQPKFRTPVRKFGQNTPSGLKPFGNSGTVVWV